MKNKKLTYVLIVAVAAVWGLILYRVFDAASGDDEMVAPTQQVTKKEAYNDYQIKPDTSHLLLNYRDPFGLVKFRDTVNAKITPSKLSRAITLPKPEINWGFVKYAGFIANPGSKKMIAILTINGKSVMLAEGESADEVKLLKNLRDSVKILYRNKSKFITRS
ncbi:hypothetical protein [Mucilaginibacter sp.]|uniref:hypothetical protein n=1 Tax=Mucilaginibacter sp. TaxID=1882438 RepID=UPI003263568E